MEKGKVLILDDDESILKILSRQLANGDYRSVAAKDAREALRILTEEPVDVVISDLHLPGVHGGSFLRIVKDHFPDIIRIILTGYPDMDSAIQGINEAGAFKYLTKPLEAKELFNVLDQAMKVRNSGIQKQKVIEGIIENTEKLQSLEDGFRNKIRASVN